MLTLCVCARAHEHACVHKAGAGGLQCWSVAGDTDLLPQDSRSPRALLLGVRSLVPSTPNTSDSELPQPRESGGGKVSLLISLDQLKKKQSSVF